MKTHDPAPGPNLRLTACAGEALAATGRWRAALGPFVENCHDPGLTNESFMELSRCAGRDLLGEIDLRFRPQGLVKVFDVFPFNGEFEVLRLKLETMAPWVDRFVIVEAGATFTGLAKPLSYPERAHELKDYAEKITYLPIEQFPSHLVFAWLREFFQRDSAIRALSGLCAPDDIVIISDADEILAPHAVTELNSPLTGVDLRFFSYFLNCEFPSSRPHIKPAITRARVLARNGLSYLRLGAGTEIAPITASKGGWHFSSLGSPARLALKMRSYSHIENAGQDEAHFTELLASLRRGEGGWRRCEIDETFPAPLRSNAAAYAEHLL
jgi:beta-1,4-mannosyl-glycoprotein beta-1,4-N-acetylglucosaminyltransferase